MTILQGTMQDGTVLPVQVDAQGRLVAEGLQGPAGPAGGSFALPPNPPEGAVLGWKGGALAWIAADAPPVEPAKPALWYRWNKVSLGGEPANLADLKTRGIPVDAQQAAALTTNDLCFYVPNMSVGQRSGALFTANGTADFRTPYNKTFFNADGSVTHPGSGGNYNANEWTSMAWTTATPNDYYLVPTALAYMRFELPVVGTTGVLREAMPT